LRTPSSSTRRLTLAAAATALLTSGCSGREAYENAFGIGWPRPKTDQAHTMYNLWLGSVAAAAAVGFGMYVIIGWTIIRDRKKSEELPRQVRYNLPIEVLYTVVPFVIIAVLFFYTAVAENKVNKLTKNPDVTIGVVGFQWNWQFNYLNDKVQVTGEPAKGQQAVLVLPVNKRVRFIETSPDVIHSFWVPAFLFKRDVIPGRLNSFEIKPTVVGKYVGRCAELCGEKHDRMNFEVDVVSAADYAAYITKLKASDAAVPDDLGKPFKDAFNNGGAIQTGEN
jgi:cytochrome c oxidase subunit 2